MDVQVRLEEFAAFAFLVCRNPSKPKPLFSLESSAGLVDCTPQALALNPKSQTLNPEP